MADLSNTDYMCRPATPFLVENEESVSPFGFLRSGSPTLTIPSNHWRRSSVVPPTPTRPDAAPVSLKRNASVYGKSLSQEVPHESHALLRDGTPADSLNGPENPKLRPTHLTTSNAKPSCANINNTNDNFEDVIITLTDNRNTAQQVLLPKRR